MSKKRKSKGGGTEGGGLAISEAEMKYDSFMLRKVQCAPQESLVVLTGQSSYLTP